MNNSNSKSKSAVSILVINDDPAVRKLLSLVLTREGYGVDCVPDGEDGIFHIENNEYELIIMDIELPDIFGNELVCFLREKNPLLPPVIGISGTPWLLEPGLFNAVLKKPCSKQNLVETVQSLLANRES